MGYAGGFPSDRLSSRATIHHGFGHSLEFPGTFSAVSLLQCGSGTTVKSLVSLLVETGGP